MFNIKRKFRIINTVNNMYIVQSKKYLPFYTAHDGVDSEFYYLHLAQEQLERYKQGNVVVCQDEEK